jgi:hypothetical protein
VLAAGSAMFGCPSCPPAVEARRLVFTEWFWSNALLALLPFMAALVVVLLFVKRLDRGGDT